MESSRIKKEIPLRNIHRLFSHVTHCLGCLQNGRRYDLKVKSLWEEERYRRKCPLLPGSVSLDTNLIPIQLVDDHRLIKLIFRKSCKNNSKNIINVNIRCPRFDGCNPAQYCGTGPQWMTVTTFMHIIRFYCHLLNISESIRLMAAHYHRDPPTVFTDASLREAQQTMGE